MPRALSHLLLTSVEDCYDPRSWSGIPFSLRQALERKVDRLTVFRPSPPQRNPKDVLLRLWFGGAPPRYPLWMTEASLHQVARELQKEIDGSRPDAVLSISSQSIAHLHDPKVQVFMLSDAPWFAWKQAYSEFEDMPMRAGEFAELESAAVRRIDGAFFSSEWGLEQAEQLYGVEREKLRLAHLGANWTPDCSREQVLERAAARPKDRIDLLFVGKDWERKGGPLAVEVAQQLFKDGQRVCLHIVGCTPILDELGPESQYFIKLHGPLFQDVAQQREKLAELFLSCHFLLVPTRAECFGIVFAEAQSFAMPPVAPGIQAIPSVIEDNVTGLLMPPDASATAYAERIRDLASDPQRYKSMATNARNRYESVLNWDRMADVVVTRIEQSLVEAASRH